MNNFQVSTLTSDKTLWNLILDREKGSDKATQSFA